MWPIRDVIGHSYSISFWRLPCPSILLNYLPISDQHWQKSLIFPHRLFSELKTPPLSAENCTAHVKPDTELWKVCDSVWGIQKTVFMSTEIPNSGHCSLECLSLRPKKTSWTQPSFSIIYLHSWARVIGQIRRLTMIGAPFQSFIIGTLFLDRPIISQVIQTIINQNCLPVIW